MKTPIKRMLDPELPLRERLFQLLSTIALAEFVIVTVYTLVAGGGLRHIVIMLCGTVLFAATVTVTFRKRMLRVGSAVSGLLYFLLYPLTFFQSGGMYGGAPVVFAFALVYVFLVTQKWERIVMMALCAGLTAACYVVAYRYPELVTRHTPAMEHVESFLSLALVTVLLCVLFTFVTAVYLTENRIVQEQKKEIEELNRAQKRFFSSMSHEIRTPVNAILALNEMTLREELPDEVRENARNIEAAGGILLHTVNEILDMSKLETGGMEIVCGNYSTTAMLSDVVNLVRLRAEEKGLDFALRVDPALPRTLYGDEVRIKQILLNVIHNAVKYTMTGSVTLSVTGERSSDGALRMICDVTDTGVGIREESIPYLFDAFHRADTDSNHKIEGTGLGLSIVKQLLDLMEGSVSVTSEYGKGSTFRITVPQTVTDETPVGEVDLRSVKPTAAKKYQSAFTAPDKRVLAVDDTPMNLLVVKKLLRDTQITVDTAASGAEALALTAQTRYDVILMDHQMPEMDGIECLRRIRAQENGMCRGTKIVCMTANVGAEMEAQYRDAGFDGYLVKPISGRTLEGELALQFGATASGEIGGDRMENVNCPCEKTGCPRFGKCDECRKHHAGPTATHPVACEWDRTAEKGGKKA